MGAIPHIYRHTAFPYRAAPDRLPQQRGVGICTLAYLQIYFSARNKTHSIDVLILKATVIGFPDSFVFHASDSPPDPTIQFIELTEAGSEPCSEITNGSTDYTIYCQNNTGVQVMITNGQLSDLILEAVFRLAAHANSKSRDIITEIFKPLTILLQLIGPLRCEAPKNGNRFRKIRKV